MSQLNNLKSNIRHYKFHSLFVRNFIIILLVIMIPLDIISLFFYTNSSKSMRQEMYQTNYNFIYTVRSIMDTLMSEMQTLAINTSMQAEIMTYFMSRPKAGADNAAQTTLVNFCKNYTYTHSGLHSIYIYCSETDTILSGSETYDFAAFSDTGWHDEYEAIHYDEARIILRARNNYYPYFLTIIKPVFSTDVDKAGAVVVNVNIQELTEVFHTLDNPTAQKIYLVDNHNRIIYSEVQNDILQDVNQIALPTAIFAAKEAGNISFKQNGISYLFSDIASQYFDWHYYCAAPIDLDSERSLRITQYLLVLLIVSLIIGAVGSFYISTRTYRPIGSILKLISSSDGHQESLYTDTTENESTYILKRISTTLKTNKTLKEELEAKLLLLKHAQIVALQSQINPHFLFNTLDTINWMAIDDYDGENRLSEALTTLGDLFRLNIDAASYLTDLQSELDYTKQYIKILKLRYTNLFEVNWSVDDDLKNCKVPRLVLQPLIENALYHGIKAKHASGTIHVAIGKENDNLLIQISDDGVGLEQSMLNRLNTELEQDYIYGSTHVGLKNINQRVKLIYGDAYGITIASDNNGTVVSLKMALIE